MRKEKKEFVRFPIGGASEAPPLSDAARLGATFASSWTYEFSCWIFSGTSRYRTTQHRNNAQRYCRKFLSIHRCHALLSHAVSKFANSCGEAKTYEGIIYIVRVHAWNQGWDHGLSRVLFILNTNLSFLSNRLDVVSPLLPAWRKERKERYNRSHVMIICNVIARK